MLPLWLAAAIVIRDLVIVAGAAAYHRYIGPFEMSPTRLSKLNTALEFVLLATVLADAAQLVEASALLSVLFTPRGVLGVFENIGKYFSERKKS